MEYEELMNLPEGTTIAYNHPYYKHTIICFNLSYGTFNSWNYFPENGESIPLYLLRIATNEDIKTFISNKKMELEILHQDLLDGLRG